MRYHLSEYRRLNYKNKICTLSDLQEIFSKHFDEKVFPVNISYYHAAFTHKSYIQINPEILSNLKGNFGGNHKPIQNLDRDMANGLLVPLQPSCNERLEYLGDSEIYSAVAQHLYCRYPEQNEGFMSKLRIKLIKSASLADLAKKAGLDKFILMSKYQEEINGRMNQNILENVMEAFLGAVMLDLGPMFARRFFVCLLQKHVDFVKLNQTNTNYKDILLRFYQSKGWGHPRYQLVEQSIDPDKRKNSSKVYLLDKNGINFTMGFGNSKKDAEQDASRRGLLEIGVLDNRELEEKLFEL